MQLNPYLTFSGNCEAAFKLYERCFGGRIVAMIRHDETPMSDKTPTDWRDKIIHGRLVVGDQVLMGSDVPPEQYEPTKGFSVTLNVDDPSEAERVFRALSADGTVRMPIQKTFWALRFGMLTDAFGIPWMINCEERHG